MRVLCARSGLTRLTACPAGRAIHTYSAPGATRGALPTRLNDCVKLDHAQCMNFGEPRKASRARSFPVSPQELTFPNDVRNGISSAMTRADGHTELRGQRVTLMGLGSFGGGVGALRFLLDQEACVTVTDLRSASQLETSLQELDPENRVTWHLGGHDEHDFREADLVVVNPAVPYDSPFLAVARRHGVPLSSEMNLFWERNPARTIAVTGSNGKSTTTAMIHAILNGAGKTSWLGGNIGKSLLTDLDRIGGNDWVVLELSSFQLEDLDRIQARPDIAVVTNFSPNHLDRHGTLDRYRLAKQTILRWQTQNDTAVVNQDDSDVSVWPGKGSRLWFGSRDLGRSGVFATNGQAAIVRVDGEAQNVDLQDCLSVPGAHNLQNASAAMCAALAAGVSLDAIRRGLQSFQALPHRLQFVGEVKGRRFYNDSKATTPESAALALRAFYQPIVLLAGGYDKQIDLSLFAAAIAKDVKAVALIGQTAEQLARLIDSHAERQGPARQVCASFNEAFCWAVEQSDPGDVVLLSPGCASYDWFRNYIERGDQFAGLIASLGTLNDPDLRHSRELV